MRIEMESDMKFESEGVRLMVPIAARPTLREYEVLVHATMGVYPSALYGDEGACLCFKAHTSDEDA